MLTTDLKSQTAKGEIPVLLCKPYVFGKVYEFLHATLLIYIMDIIIANSQRTAVKRTLVTDVKHSPL